MLCALEKPAPRRVRGVTPGGEEHLFALSASVENFENLLAFSMVEALTMTSSRLRRYSEGGVSAEVIVQAAGVSTEGEPFLSGRKGDWVSVYLSGGRVRQLRLPPDAPQQGAVCAVAVEGNRSLVYGLDFAAWYDGDQLEESFKVDEERYHNDIFPHLWSLAVPRFATAAPDGTVVLSASGLNGIALIGLRIVAGEVSEQHTINSRLTNVWQIQ
jgi:hypothetical protein